jgi:hypothetical protein
MQQLIISGSYKIPGIGKVYVVKLSDAPGGSVAIGDRFMWHGTVRRVRGLDVPKDNGDWVGVILEDVK